MRERDYQAHLIKRLKILFPGCIVLKNDSSYIQGVPDLLMLYYKRWAAFEVKRSADAPVRSNQIYYIETLNEMSFAALIHPDNEEEVLDALQCAFASTRAARRSKRQ